VTYDNPDYLDTVLGEWQFAEDEQVLMTSLQRPMDPMTGFGDIYYFPHNKIEQLTEDEMILVSDTAYSWFSSGNSCKTVTKYYFNH
jgi:hypothetical protein